MGRLNLRRVVGFKYSGKFHYYACVIGGNAGFENKKYSNNLV
jgi:hypothetical protein